MKEIIFNPANYVVQEFLEKPKPAKNYLPDWYKESDAFIGGKLNFNNGYNPDIKLCMPYFDTLTSGYIVELYQDIYVTRNSNGMQHIDVPEVSPLGIPADKQKSDIGLNIPRPFHYSQNMWTWNMPWSVTTPKGYSTMFIHPINRYDLPFISTSGIVDTDMFALSGNLPFFIKEDFEGIISKGTPIIQLIPFKRDNWNSRSEEYNDVETSKLKFLMRSVMFGAYKKMFWQRKEYK
jgi:hypothetical protein